MIVCGHLNGFNGATKYTIIALHGLTGREKGLLLVPKVLIICLLNNFRTIIEFSLVGSLS